MWVPTIIIGCRHPGPLQDVEFGTIRIHHFLQSLALVEEIGVGCNLRAGGFACLCAVNAQLCAVILVDEFLFAAGRTGVFDDSCRDFVGCDGCPNDYFLALPLATRLFSFLCRSFHFLNVPTVDVASVAYCLVFRGLHVVICHRNRCLGC